MTHRKLFPLVIAAPTLLAAALPAYAHHGGPSHYDVGQEIVVEGTVTRLELVNPHAYVYFDVDGEEWRCEMNERVTMVRQGWADDTLVAGDRITVTGNPARREENVCSLERIDVADGRVMTRMAVIQGERAAEPAPEPIAVAGNESIFGNWAAADGTRGAPEPGAAGMAPPANGMAPGMAPPGMAADGAPGMAGLPPRPGGGLVARVEYTAAGQAVVDRYDPDFDNPSLQCQASVLFGLLHHSLPNLIEQVDASTIRFVYGYMDMERRIHLDQSGHPDNVEPTTLGHSIGQWQGDRLLVDTTGFADGVIFPAALGEGPGAIVNSDQLHLQETIYRDESTGQLVIDYTMEDPLYWTGSISGSVRLNPSTTAYQPYNCVELSGENNIRPE